MKLEVYTDGSCSPNPGPGGWGVAMLYGAHEKTFYGSHPNTTNNQMELMAAIEGLKAIKWERASLTLYTDSQYVINGVTKWIKGWVSKGWKTSSNSPVKNVELWKELHSLTERHEVEWVWVKGHSGNEWNEVVDNLAKQGTIEAKQ